MRMRHAAVLAGLALGLMSGAAKAAYIVTIEQMGADVVATGSGSIDTDSLSFVGAGFQRTGIQSNNARLILGTSNTSVDVYSGLVGPGTFGGNNGFIGADEFSGNIVGVLGSASLLYVPQGYQSGSDLLTSGATFNNTTLAGLGLTPGSSFTYIVPGPGSESLPADTFTIDVQGVSAVPLPASAPMFGAALLALGAVGYGVKRKRAAAAA